jgi:hypothetical protein
MRKFLPPTLPHHPRHRAAHLGHHLGELAHFLHHLLHLIEAVEQVVEFGDGDAAAFGDADAAFGIEDGGFGAFAAGHGADHAFHAAEFAFALVEVDAFHLVADAGQHADEFFEGTHVLHLAELIEEVIEGEFAFAHLFFHALGVVHADGFGGALDEAHDVAHAEDARGHALGVEGFEVVEFFAGADELDGLAGDGFETEGGTAASVAVELGEDGAGNVQGFVEMGGDCLLYTSDAGDEQWMV